MGYHFPVSSQSDLFLFPFNLFVCTGKSFPSSITITQLLPQVSSRILSSSDKLLHPSPNPKPSNNGNSPNSRLSLMDNSSGSRSQRLPLSAVVSDCVKRWFEDTLKEAKAGDSAMQILVGQMYFNGYGVSRDSQKGRAWINKASKVRSSAWKVSEKRPGYNVSDSDSDDTKVDAK